MASPMLARCVLHPMNKHGTIRYYNQVNAINDIKTQQFDEFDTVNEQFKNYTHIGNTFQDSKEWKFSLYYLENLIVAALSPVPQYVQTLKQDQVNVPFEMRFIRETRNSKTLMEQQEMVTSFVSKICEEGIYSKPAKYRNNTNYYHTKNKSVGSSSDSY